MNREEAEKMLKIMATADGGCEYCARQLFDCFVKEFPEFTDMAMEIFKKRFGDEPEALEEKDRA